LPGSAFGSPAPYLLAQVLALCGLISLLFFSLRGRLAPARWVGALRVAYLTLAALFFAAAAVSGVYSAIQFHGAHWARGDLLVLDRPAPLGSVVIPRTLVATITEFTVPERTLLGGRRASVQFEVVTSSGESYWSSSVHRKERADALRATLVSATGGRLTRFQIGRDTVLR